MLRSPPKYTYNGLTIIMSFPSRFDTKELLSGVTGHFFNSQCLMPECNRLQVDIRLIDDPSPLLPDTKVILLLGEKAHRLYTKAPTSLDENRGSPIIVDGIPCISSFAPQDALDARDYEKTHNPAYETVAEFMSDEINAGEAFESKGRGRTARANYRWWLIQDTKKALRILDHGRIPSEAFPEPDYIINPSDKILIDVLTKTKNTNFYFDIETDFNTLDIRCMSFMFESNPTKVYVFQFLDLHYKPAYSNLHHILRAVAVAMRDNTSVAHNGSAFDFLVFALKLHIPIGRKAYDTMIAASRIYPDIEKSLGHWISLLTYLPYHKNEGVHTYRTEQQAQQLMLYCGKDSYSMFLVKLGQNKLCEKDEGLKNSIALANSQIRPALVQTITGMRYNEPMLREWVNENDRRMKQYIKMMGILHGKEIEPLISNKKCVAYFHDALGYKVVARTKKGAPSLAEDALLLLKLKYPENIVIDFLIKYRAKKKETGVLKFKPWIAPPFTLEQELEIEEEEETPELV